MAVVDISLAPAKSRVKARIGGLNGVVPASVCSNKSLRAVYKRLKTKAVQFDCIERQIAMNKTKRAKRPRNKEASQLALLQAAATLFSIRGMTNTTTREIAAKANRAEGLISRYFKGKSGLAKAVEDNADRLHIPSTPAMSPLRGINFSCLNDCDTPAQRYVANRIKAALANEFSV